MNDILKKPYELSVWEDVTVYVDVEGNQSKKISDLQNEIAYQYLTEQRAGIIGSHSMDTPIRATNVKFTKNINGEKTLTFDMFHNYMDDNGELVENPWTQFLVNERKVKLFYDNEWNDFIVKNIQENSDSNTFSYTCKDLAVVELSKTGFSIQLDTELNNNLGTVNELADKILSGSDWRRDPEVEPIIRQKNSEALYKVHLTAAISTKDINTDEPMTIAAGEYIYVYYNSYINETKDFYQFIYYSGEGEPALEDDNTTVVIDNINTFDLYYEGAAVPAHDSAVVTMYRGNRLVKTASVAYDTILEQPVTIYKNLNGDKKYGFTRSDVLTSDTVKNYCTNGVSFQTVAPWVVSNISVQVENVIYPLVSADNITVPRESYIRVNFKSNEGYLLNPGPYDFCDDFHEIGEGEECVLRIKYMTLNNGEIVYPSTVKLNGIVSRFSTENGQYIKDEEEDIFTFEEFQEDAREEAGHFFYSRAKASKALSYADLIHEFYNHKYFIALYENTPSNTDYYIYSVEFFKYIVDGNGEMVFPDSVPTSRVYTKYYFYDPIENEDAETEDDYRYEYSDYTFPVIDNVPVYTPFYDEGERRFEKRRSITAKESNRFNLLQDLCETFECWIKFTVAHNSDGSIAMRYDDEFGRYIQDKTISFYEDISTQNHTGFKYGINLKSVERTLESDEIVTKIIVKPNNCEFANGGFCTIQSAQDNFIKENWALDFDYYVQKGLIDKQLLMNDLYLNANGYIGLYPRLHDINEELTEKSEELVKLLTQIQKLTADYDAYSKTAASASENINLNINLIYNHCGDTLEDFSNIYSNEKVTIRPSKKYIVNGNLTEVEIYEGDEKIETITSFPKNQDDEDKTYPELYNQKSFTTPANASHAIFIGGDANTVIFSRDARRMITQPIEHEEIYNLYVQIGQLQSQYNNASTMAGQYKDSLNAAKERQQELEDDLAEMGEQSDAVEKEFLHKYTHYIQEGSWSDDNYMDHNLYYLDALSVLADSAFPKVSYTIDVIELSQLDGYEDYKFDIGNKTYVEDTEFFGWTKVNGLKTPAKEKVVISEVTYDLDNPDQNYLKVQNYKTQFEDLFQRITATTQGLQFHEGSYANAANAFSSPGVISTEVLESSMANAGAILQNGVDQNVVWDSTGITLTKSTNPTVMVKLTSDGIIVSNDGGQTFKTAIDGNGIAAGTIQSGYLDTAMVRIQNNGMPSFSWTKDGLVANGFVQDENGNISYLTGSNVTFNRFGLYGSKTNFLPNNVNDVEQNALFALTWNGLFIKSDHDNGGHISISPTEDIVIYDGNNTLRGKFGVLKEEQLVKIPIESAYYANDNENSEIGESNEIQSENKLTDGSMYGISLFDENGTPTLSTLSDGTLRLTSAISIGLNDEANVFLGAGRIVDSEQGIYRIFSIFNGSEVFYINSDGHMTAIDATIEGTINATSGQIGDILIDSGALVGSNFTIDDDGITIYRGDVPVFYIDDSGNLVFSGNISADTGTIGGFVIGENTISSESITLHCYEDEDNPSYIDVQNLYIGSGAKIKEKLEIGNLSLINPEDDDFRKVLALGTDNFYMKNNGEIGGKSWNIDTNGLATFSNASISGTLNAANILAATFEVNNVRAMGGKFIFKSATEQFTIGEFDSENNVLPVEVSQDFYKLCSVDSYVRCSRENDSNDAKIASVSGENGTVIYLTNYNGDTLPEEYHTFDSLVLYGVNGDSVITISSDKVDASKNSIFASTALKMTTLNYNSDASSLEYAMNLQLGDLSGLPIDGDFVASGYGLYAENVYLKGMLYFPGENGETAGFITENMVKIPENVANSDITNMKGEHITMFAGGSSLEAPYESTFFVTAEGSVYASKAYFTDSVFVKSRLEAAELITATLSGNGSDGPALAIHYTDHGEGIQFFNDNKTDEEDQEDTVTLGIGGDNLYYGNINNKFITVEQQKVLFSGKQFSTGTMVLDDEGLKLQNVGNDNVTLVGEIEAQGESIAITNSNSSLSIGKSNINLSSSNLMIGSHLMVKGDGLYYVE